MSIINSLLALKNAKIDSYFLPQLSINKLLDNTAEPGTESKRAAILNAIKIEVTAKEITHELRAIYKSGK